MNTKLPDYKGHRIEIDEDGVYWLDGVCRYEGLHEIRRGIDRQEAFNKATPRTFLRIEYPYLQIWEARFIEEVLSTRHTIKILLTKDKHGSIRELLFDGHMLPYDEALLKEALQLFKNRIEIEARLAELIGDKVIAKIKREGLTHIPQDMRKE